jgi:aldehyde dehydrogenase (NAD+)
MGVENPATEEIVCEVAMGNAEDADRAILAARAAFDSWTVPPGQGTHRRREAHA